MANKNGNLFGMGGSGKEAFKKRKQGTKGFYKLAFIETYENVTENDVEIRRKYAIDAIARYVGVPNKMVSLRKKSTNQTLTSLDEVFYVKLGVDTIGKVSLRVQRMFSRVNLDIIFQEKRLSDNSKSKRNTMKGYGKQSKSKSTEKRRQNRGKGANGKFTR